MPGTTAGPEEIAMTANNDVTRAVDETSTSVTPASTPAVQSSREVFDAFKEIMDLAAADEVIGQRLALAGTTVQVHFEDDPELVMTMLLDRVPIETIGRAVGHPEVHLYIHSRDVFRFWTGDYHLAMGIAKGEVTYRGPVRKMLRVVPIARRLAGRFRQLAEQRDVAAAPTAVAVPAARPPVPADGNGSDGR